MSDNSVVDAAKILKGEISPEVFTTPYIMLYDRKSRRIINAINLLAKYGWRPVASWGGYVIMERT